MDDDFYKQLLSKMCSYCAIYEKCKHDIYVKLDKYGASKLQQEQIIEYLETNNFINEERFANSFASDKFKFNKWGKNKIVYNLKEFKIEQKNIAEALNNINSDDYERVLLNLLKTKRAQIKDTDNYKIRQKLINYAISKGFEYELIYETISKIE
jgi:regulatory protein